MRRRREDLNSTQKSVWYWSVGEDRHPKLPPVPNYIDYSYAHILIEDTSNNVFPTYGYSKKEYEILLTPPSPDVEQLIEDALERRNHSRNLSDAFWGFAHECVSIVMSYEEDNYEIVFLSDEENKIVGFRFARIPVRSLVKQGDDIYQIIPEEVAEREDLDSQSIQMSADSILTFKLPEYIQGGYKDMMESLCIMSNLLVPDFVKQNMRGEARVPYDFKEFDRAQKMALAEATKLIGWDARQMFKTHIMEHYWFYRLLGFEKFKAVFRNEIINILNKGLQKVGEKMGFEAQLSIKGLPTLDDVNKAFQQLDEGGYTYEEVWEPFRNY